MNDFETLDQLAATRDFVALRDAARDAAEAHPDAWQPAYHEGRALLELNEDTQAESLLATTRSRFPHLHQVAVLYAYAGAKLLSPAAALDRWHSLADELPAAPGLAIGYAQALIAAGRPADAEAAIARALGVLPDCIPLLVQHAALAADRQDWPLAAERWQTVLAIQPTRLDALIGAISALREAGATLDAEQIATTALAAHPDDPDLNTTCAALATAQSDWHAAIARLSRALAARPADAAIRLPLAAAYQRVARTADAEAVLQDGLALTPDSQTMLRAYAEIATQTADWPQAAPRWAEVYAHCPPHITIYHLYAEALIGNEEYEAAERILAEGVGFAPTAKALLVGYAQAAGRRYDWTESAKRWSALRRAYPEDEEVMQLITQARKLQFRHTNQAFLDQKAISTPQLRGALGEKPRVNTGPKRDLNFGPTALDLLIAGKIEATPEAPPKPGWFKRLFGGR